MPIPHSSVAQLRRSLPTWWWASLSFLFFLILGLTVIVLQKQLRLSQENRGRATSAQGIVEITPGAYTFQNHNQSVLFLTVNTHGANVGEIAVNFRVILPAGTTSTPSATEAVLTPQNSNLIYKSGSIGIINGMDLMHTGSVRKVDVAALNDRMEFGEVVLLSPLGYSPTGEVFNLTLEDVATATAIALDADKLVFLMDIDGVTGKKGELLKELTIAQAQEALNGKRKLSDDVSLFLPCAIRACEAGVARTHLISRHTDGSVLQELFSDEGIGTMVVESTLNTLREATIDDIGGIIELLRPLEESGILVRRSRELLEREIDRFVVLEHDHRIIGCAALYPFPDEAAAELACLAVDAQCRDRGYGEAVLNHMISIAKGQGLKKLFVLTTRTAHWFIERGFKESDVAELPAQKKSLYNYQRKSKVFVRKI